MPKQQGLIYKPKLFQHRKVTTKFSIIGKQNTIKFSQKLQGGSLN